MVENANPVLRAKGRWRAHSWVCLAGEGQAVAHGALPLFFPYPSAMCRSQTPCNPRCLSTPALGSGELSPASSSVAPLG